MGKGCRRGKMQAVRSLFHKVDCSSIDSCMLNFKRIGGFWIQAVTFI